jgi:cytochrome P450
MNKTWFAMVKSVIYFRLRVNVDNLQNSKQILKFNARRDFFYFSTGDKWKIRRKLLTPSFHFKILHDFVAVFNDQSKVLLNILKKKADGVSTVDVFNDITLCALDIICGRYFILCYYDRKKYYIDKTDYI